MSRMQNINGVSWGHRHFADSVNIVDPNFSRPCLFSTLVAILLHEIFAQYIYYPNDIVSLNMLTICIYIYEFCHKVHYGTGDVWVGQIFVQHQHRFVGNAGGLSLANCHLCFGDIIALLECPTRLLGLIPLNSIRNFRPWVIPAHRIGEQWRLTVDVGVLSHGTMLSCPRRSFDDVRDTALIARFACVILFSDDWNNN
jgi:hypothetical protein